MNNDAELIERLREVEAQRDEATNWSAIVDRHGTDRFDDLAEQWLALPAIRRVHQAMASPFAPYASEDIMQRFLQMMRDQLQLAYVEGCLAGVRTEVAAADRLSQRQGDAGMVLPEYSKTTRQPVIKTERGAWSNHHYTEEGLIGERVTEADCTHVIVTTTAVFKSGADEATPPGQRLERLEEALLKTQIMLEAIVRLKSTNMTEVREQIMAIRQALADTSDTKEVGHG